MSTLYLGYSHTVVEDCEDAWAAGDADMTVTLDTTVEKVGSGCAKCAVAAGASVDDVMMYENFSSTDISAKTYLTAWVRSSVVLAAGDVQIGYSATNAMGGTPVWFDVPAITTVDNWHRIVVALTGTRSAVLCVGFRMHVDKGAFDFYADDIRALIANDYEPMAVVGLDDPDEVQHFPGALHELLDGSAQETFGAKIRLPIVDLGVLTTKSDRVFVDTWYEQTDKVVYYNLDECAVVFQEPSRHSQPWRFETELGRSVVLKLREKTAWTVAPPSWSRT
jgi:hypothetical protein